MRSRLLTVLVLMALTFGIVDCGRSAAAASSGPTAFGAFAGYIEFRPLHSLSASWRVPTETNPQPRGETTTSIAAAGPGRDEPFVQLGTSEGVLHSALGITYSPDYAFCTFGGNERYMFPAHPGDDMSASLTLAGGRWHLTMIDHTTRRHVTFSTREEARHAFNFAQWLQADRVSDQFTGALYPFPSLSTITFRDLQINGSAPTYASVLSQWMSENGTNLAPSPLHHGSFSLAQRQLTTAGRHYLAIAAPTGRAYDRFFRRADRWRPSTRAAAILAEERRYRRVLVQFSRRLRAGPWPAPTRSLAERLARANLRVVGVLRTEPVRTRGGFRTWFGRYRAGASIDYPLAETFRRALHVPQYTP